MTNWQSPDKAPKDGTLILGDFGWPWLCYACWNEVEGQWSVSVKQINLVGGKCDPYFETNREKHKDLKMWLPVPDIDTKPATESK